MRTRATRREGGTKSSVELREGKGARVLRPLETMPTRKNSGGKREECQVVIASYINSVIHTRAYRSNEVAALVDAREGAEIPTRSANPTGRPAGICEKKKLPGISVTRSRRRRRRRHFVGRVYESGISEKTLPHPPAPVTPSCDAERQRDDR